MNGIALLKYRAGQIAINRTSALNAMLELGAIFESQNKIAEAILWWEQAATLSAPEAFFNLGMLYTRFCVRADGCGDKTHFLGKAVEALTPVATSMPEAALALVDLYAHVALSIADRMSNMNVQGQEENIARVRSLTAEYWGKAAECLKLAAFAPAETAMPPARTGQSLTTADTHAWFSSLLKNGHEHC